MGHCSNVTALPALNRFGNALSIQIATVFFAAMLTGCQMPQPDLKNRLAAHVATIDFTGLARDTNLADVNARVAVPLNWDAMPSQSSALYFHQQWRSPSRMTGVGVAWIHMPLPMSAKALVWFAKSQYSKQASKDHKADATMLGEWTDSLGREWFEGENGKYHVKGYVVTNGFDAWAVYTGYRLASKPRRRELEIAFRSMDSIVPLPLLKREAAARSDIDSEPLELRH